MNRAVMTGKRFFGVKFGRGNDIPDGIYAIPIGTKTGNAFMKYEIRNGSSFGQENYRLFWDEQLTVSWYTEPKPAGLVESKFAKRFRSLLRAL